MKKVIFTSRYPIEFDLIPFPGMEKVIKTLSSSHELLYLSMSWSKYKNQEILKYMKVKKIPLNIDLSKSFSKWSKTLLYYFFLPSTIRMLKKEKPDIIICRENLSFIPSFLSLVNVPILIEIGDWWPSMLLNKSRLGRKLAKLIENFEVKIWNKMNCLVIVHTNAEKEDMLKRGILKDKIRFVNLPMYGGVYSLYRADKERKERGFKDSDFVVAFHGIIHENKGYYQVLKWWARLIKIHPNWKLLFIGATMGEDKFKKMISELRIDKNVIAIYSWMDQEKLNKYLNIADCLLATRRNSPENMGTTPSAIPHNLMTGKPTLATGLPGIKEAIQDKKNGFIFKPDSYESFKTSLEYIYNHPKESKKIGLNGIKRAKSYFSSIKASKTYLKIIQEVTG